MKMGVERPSVSQRHEQPAWRGVEKASELFASIAPYADDASASTLVAVAQSSQFTLSRGNRQERSCDGFGTHVIPLALEVLSCQPVQASPAGPGKPRSA